MDTFFDEYYSHLPKTRAEHHIATIDDLFCSNAKPLRTPREQNDVHNIKFYRLGGYKLILSLKHPTSLYYRGFLGVRCLAGSAEIDGFILKQDNSQIFHTYSLASHSASSLSTVDCDFALSDEVITKLDSLNVYNEIKNDMTDDSLPSCLLLLWKNEFPSLLKLNNELRYSLFPSRRSCGGINNFSDFEEFTNCIFDIASGNRITKKMILNPKMKEFAQELLSYNEPRLLICGGKGVGKSTGIRYVTNQLLSKWERVLFIDFDIGQPEFTLPGCVSLHLLSEPLLGPSYTHLKSPLKSIFLGFVNADMCFNNYRTAIKEIKNYCTDIAEFSTIPWVINTMGYVKGCGLLLLNDIISSFDLSHVVELRSTTELNVNFAKPPLPQTVMKSVENCPYLHYEHKLFQQATSNYRSHISPKMSRQLMALFYFIGSSNELRTQRITIQNGLSREGTPFVSLIWNHSVLQRGEIVAVCSSVNRDDSVVYHTLGFGKVISSVGSDLVLLTPLSENEFSGCTMVRGELSLSHDFFNQHLPDGNSDSHNKVQILLTHGTKSLCPALFFI